MFWRGKTFLFKRWMAFQDRFGLYGYIDWIRDNEPQPQELEEQARCALDFSYRPLVSCLLVLNNGHDFEEISHTLNSFFAQTYDNWEICCFVPNYVIDERLQQAVHNDARLCLLENTSKEDFFVNGITVDSFHAIFHESKCIRGEFFCVLQAGDIVAPTMLFRIVEQLNRAPDVDLIYCDEDRITQADHTRYSPWFKPDWSPELLCSVNYLAGALVRKTHFQNICAISESNAAFKALIMRCAEETRHIIHLPEIMVHFLDHPEIRENHNKVNFHYAYIKDYFRRMGIPELKIQTTPQGNPHLIWQSPQPLVSIIIPTKDHLRDLQRALSSIRELTSYTHYELVLVDNDSRDAATLQYYEQLKHESDVHILPFAGLFNFSEAINLGASQANGEVYVFLNNDVQVINADWLTELVRWALLPGVGIVGAKLLYPNGTIQHAGLVLGMEGHANHIFAHYPEGSQGMFGSVEWYRNYSAVTGACMAMRRSVYDDIGGFDASYQLAFSDIEICRQTIRRGYRVVFNPFARLIHHEGQTRADYIPPQDIATGYHRLRGVISQGDPFYNPNLSYAVCYPTFRRKNEEAVEERLIRIVSMRTNS
ncbi:MAG: glycosyltransferase family 2 protein [Anaerolineales bacterium]|nr:glycosyltransferase family 2 protein [Anaerolineales bacterium]